MLHSVLKKGRAVALVAATLIAAGQVAHADDVQLPRTMVWTSYDQGSAGFVEASAIADALDRQFGTTDVLIVLPVEHINSRYFAHFGAPDELAPTLAPDFGKLN